MPDDNLLSLDSALPLMNTPPAAEEAGTAGWDPPAAAEAKPVEQKQEAAKEPPAADDTAPVADTAAGGQEDTPADDQGETKDGAPDPEAALPPIEAPSSWKAEEKEVFKSLPRAAQEAIARREQDRTTELRNLQNTQAEQRKQVEGEVAKLKGLADQVASVANERIADLAREFPEIKTQADVEALAATDPARFNLFQAKLMRFNAAQQAHQQAQQALQEKGEQAGKEMLAKAQEALVTAFPAWKDPAVGRKEMTELQDYAISLGVPEQAARGTLDPHIYKLAQKAMLYDRAQAAKTQAVKRDPPKVIKPGAPITKTEQADEKRAAQLKRLDKTGDIEDAVGLLRA